MNKQETKNCHYIPRCQTKPWEGDSRYLSTYSFEKKCFQKKEPSKNLFSEHKIYPQTLEEFLNNNCEKHINNMRPHIERGEQNVLDNPDYYRASKLLVVLQRPRLKVVNQSEHLAVLTELMNKPPGFLEELKHEHGHGLLIIQTDSLWPMFFPSTGSFTLVSPELSYAGQPIIPWATPVTHKCAIVGFDFGLNATAQKRSEIFQIVERVVPKILSASSVGTKTADKVLILPKLFDEKPEEEIKQYLLQSRVSNDEAIVKHNLHIANGGHTGAPSE